MTQEPNNSKNAILYAPLTTPTKSIAIELYPQESLATHPLSNKLCNQVINYQYSYQ